MTEKPTAIAIGRLRHRLTTQASRVRALLSSSPDPGRLVRRAAVTLRRGRTAVERWKPPLWVQALLLALAPLLVLGFYTVVDGAVQRGAARRAAAPSAARAAALGLQNVVWECTPAPEEAPYSTCRPVPVRGFENRPVRLSALGS